MSTTINTAAAAIAAAVISGQARAADDWENDTHSAAFYALRLAKGRKDVVPLQHGDRVRFVYEAGRAGAETYTVVYGNASGVKLIPDHAPWARRFAGDAAELVKITDQTPAPAAELLGQARNWLAYLISDETAARYANRTAEHAEYVETAAYGVAYCERMHAAELVEVTVTTTTTHRLTRSEIAELADGESGQFADLIREHRDGSVISATATTAEGEQFTLF